MVISVRFSRLLFLSPLPGAARIGGRDRRLSGRGEDEGQAEEEVQIPQVTGCFKIIGRHNVSNMYYREND